MVVLRCACWAVLIAILTLQVASAEQRCPPNSQPASVAIPGNLATAQCFCNPGFAPSGRRCVRVQSPTNVAPAPPARMLVAPQQPR